MVRRFDAIFGQGALSLLEPLAMPEGTRVHLSVEEETAQSPIRTVAKIRTPKLANLRDAADFVMEVQVTL